MNVKYNLTKNKITKNERNSINMMKSQHRSGFGRLIQPEHSSEFLLKLITTCFRIKMGKQRPKSVKEVKPGGHQAIEQQLITYSDIR